MPRSSSSSRQSNNKKPVPKDPTKSQWIMIAEETLFENNGNEENKMTYCKLRHPKSGEPALYLVCKGGEVISEVMKYTPEFGSWLIGNTVQKDGSFIVQTPVDPLFLVLPYFINAGKAEKFMALDQIVQDAELQDCSQLLGCKGLDFLDQVCDVKGGDEIKVYRYNRDKTLTWLRLKAENVAEALQNSQLQVSNRGAHSANFVCSRKDQAEGKDAFMRYAHGLISDYIPVELGISLKEYLGLQEIKENIQPETKDEEPPSKKSKMSKNDFTPTEDYSLNCKILKKENSKKNQSASQKKLNKVDKSGMKSISSFFLAKS